MSDSGTLAGEAAGGTRGRHRALLNVGILVPILAVILFLSAGRLDWGMGWALVGMYTIMFAISAVVLPLNPEFIEERIHIKADAKAWDKLLAGVLSVLSPVGVLVVAGLDMRFGWSPSIPLACQLFGLVVATCGYYLGIWAASSNKFYSRFVRIQTDRGHTVVTTGPYRHIRHPGYAGSLLFHFGVPVTLGSFAALALSEAISLLVIVRTALEDGTLCRELEGYEAYARQVPYRLIPGVW